MNDRTKFGLRLLVAALAMGVVTEFLLNITPWGINLFIWIVLLVTVVAYLAHKQELNLSAERRWLVLPILWFPAALAWRDSVTLAWLDLLALIVAISLASIRVRAGWLMVAGAMEYLLGILIAGFNSFIGTLMLLISDIEWQTLPRGSWTKSVKSIVTGLLIATPLLLIFGFLFMSADAVFESYVNRAFNFNLENFFSHFFLILFWAALIGGLMRGMLMSDEFQIQQNRPENFYLGIVEIGTVLAVLDLLFLSFVIIQLRYLFGGSVWAQTTTGITYSDYARRGFFELVTVAALVLPLLLFSHWLLNKEQRKHETIFAILAGIQILLLFVIMFSAVQRMVIYQEGYGMTELRLYTTVFMGWLAIVFIWFSLTVLRGQRKNFAFGALLTCFAVIGFLHLLNPDAFITRYNLAHWQQNKNLDSVYLLTLSADGLPELMKGLPKLSNDDRAAVSKQLLDRWGGARPDWRSWNLARWQAWQTIQQQQQQLNQAAQGKGEQKLASSQ